MDAKNHAHTDSYWAPVEGCQITSRSADAVKSQAGEDVIEQSIQFTDVYRMMVWRALLGFFIYPTFPSFLRLEVGRWAVALRRLLPFI